MADIAIGVGLLAATLSLIIPLIFWLLLRRFWKPNSRKSYALKFALWPAIFISFMLGGPLARELLGIQSRYQSDLMGTLMGVSGASILFAPIFFGIGYWLGKKKFHQKPSAALAKDELE